MTLIEDMKSTLRGMLEANKPVIVDYRTRKQNAEILYKEYVKNLISVFDEFYDSDYKDIFTETKTYKDKSFKTVWGLFSNAKTTEIKNEGAPYFKEFHHQFYEKGNIFYYYVRIYFEGGINRYKKEKYLELNFSIGQEGDLKDKIYFISPNFHEMGINYRRNNRIDYPYNTSPAWTYTEVEKFTEIIKELKGYEKHV